MKNRTSQGNNPNLKTIGTETKNIYVEKVIDKLKNIKRFNETIKRISKEVREEK